MMPELKPLPWKLELGGYRWERLKNKHFGHMYNSKGECIGRGVPYKEALELLTPRPCASRPDGGDSPAQTALTDIIKSLMQTFTPMRYIHESTQEGILAHMEREDQRAYQILKAALAVLTAPVAKEGE